MKAIYHGVECNVTDELIDGVVLDGELRVGYGDLGLVIDPTDAQLEACRAGEEIPLDAQDEAEYMALLDRLAGDPPNPAVLEAKALWQREHPKQIQRRT